MFVTIEVQAGNKRESADRSSHPNRNVRIAINLTYKQTGPKTNEGVTPCRLPRYIPVQIIFFSYFTCLVSAPFLCLELCKSVATVKVVVNSVKMASLLHINL
jgi:hypothetical protein